MVMLSRSRETQTNQPSHSLAAAGRKTKLKRSLVEFSRAYSTASNPVDPTPENLEQWLDAAYPKDENGVSIRHQIDKTMPEQQQWVDDLKAGKICPLAALAFECGLDFDPPVWAEKMRLTLQENAPAAKNGGRIKCPVHLREAMEKLGGVMDANAKSKRARMAAAVANAKSHVVVGNRKQREARNKNKRKK